MYYYRAILQSASDAAALAGAKAIMDGTPNNAATDAATYAAKYSIEGVTVTNYSVIPGRWTRAGGFVPTGGAWANANAIRDSVSFGTNFTFGRLFGLNSKTLHAGSDAIVGNVGATSCVRPLGVPYQSLLNQLHDDGFHPTLQMAASYTLADSDIARLKTSTQLTRLKVTDATDSPDPINGSYYLLQMGPYAPAAGTPVYSPSPDWGGNSVNGGFPARFAGDCSSSTWRIAIGDWMQGKQGNVTGPMQQAYDDLCGTHITGNNGSWDCTGTVAHRSIKVAMWATQNSTICSPRCFQVKYLGTFVIVRYILSNTAPTTEGLWGYFAASASDGSITDAGTGATGGTLQRPALVK
jgi:hypothetical protein